MGTALLVAVIVTVHNLRVSFYRKSPEVVAASEHWVKEIMAGSPCFGGSQLRDFVTRLNFEIATHRVFHGHYPVLAKPSDAMQAAIKHCKMEGIRFPLGAVMVINQDQVVMKYGLDSGMHTAIWERSAQSAKAPTAS